MDKASIQVGRTVQGDDQYSTVRVDEWLGTASKFCTCVDQNPDPDLRANPSSRSAGGPDRQVPITGIILPNTILKVHRVGLQNGQSEPASWALSARAALHPTP